MSILKSILTQYWWKAESLKVFSPVRRPLIPAAMLDSLITPDKNFLGAVGITLGATIVGTLGFFCVVVKGAFHAVNQFVVEMEAELGQDILDLLQCDKHDIIADAHKGWRDKVYVLYTLDISQQISSGLRLVGVRVQLAKRYFAMFELAVSICFHASDTNCVTR